MSRIVLLHGWGYDASLLDAVHTLLPRHLDVTTLDLRFYGNGKIGSGGTANLAVGHSLGALWWLTQAPNAWQRLLCINGFPRFTEADGYAPAVAPRVLARMRTQFTRDPVAVLADFHARCGGHAPRTPPNIEGLDAGLGWLAEYDGRAALAARRADVFALAGSEDPIVPRAMSSMAFASLPAGHLEFSDAPGHLLPLTQPEFCAQRIESLAA